MEEVSDGDTSDDNDDDGAKTKSILYLNYYSSIH